MGISKVKIKNFKCYRGEFEINLKEGMNVLVGRNDSGKSTILQAIHIALTGIFSGRNIRNEITQYLFNAEVVEAYINSVISGNPLPPPEISVEIFFNGSIDPEFEGNENSESKKSEGICFSIKYNEKYNDEYCKVIDSKKLKSIPIEYYEASWSSFARDNYIMIRSIPLKSVLIDSSNYQYKNASDIYISRIVKDLLSVDEVTAVAQAHRNMKDEFMADPSITAINERINKEASLADGQVSLSVDLGTKTAWENSLITQLDNIPFGFIGKGEQCIIKTELALAHKKARDAEIILIEEPENHLTYSKLNQLLSAIEDKYDGKQFLITTHSSLVANKLGLDKLIMVENHSTFLFDFLSDESANFFRKIAGYDTLRLILCEKAILVEGASDELVVQKAYMVKNGKLPIQDGVDVISVGTSFLRFLEIAEKLETKVAVVTDNDGDPEALKKKYGKYLGKNQRDTIKICFDECVDKGNLKIGVNNYNYNTLEPKMLKANNSPIMNKIFGTQYKTDDELRKYMKHNKTECAMAIFDTEEPLVFPDYIMEAIKI